MTATDHNLRAEVEEYRRDVQVLAERVAQRPGPPEWLRTAANGFALAVALVILGVLVYMLSEWREQTILNGEALERQIGPLQAEVEEQEDQIAALEAEIDARDAAIAEAVAYIGALATETVEHGGNPGLLNLDGIPGGPVDVAPGTKVEPVPEG